MATVGDTGTGTSRTLVLDEVLRSFQRRLGPGPGRTRFAGAHYLTAAVFIGALALVIPATVHSLLGQTLVDTWLLYCIAAIGFYWMFGLAGRFAFCQTIMMAGGAYMSAYLSREGAAFWVSVVGAVVTVSLAAAILAAILRRSHEFYFAIATLATTEIGLVVFQNATTFTGPNGTVLDVPPISVFGHALTTGEDIFWALLVALALILLLNALLEHSPLRRDVIAARELPAVAKSSGVRVEWIQGIMFVIGSAAGALSGVLFAHVESFVGTGSFNLNLAVGIFLMLLLGGARSVWGPVIGAAIYVELPEILNRTNQYSTIVYGVILLVVIIAMPSGIMGYVSQVGTYLNHRLTRWLDRRRPAGVPATAAGPSVEAGTTGPAVGTGQPGPTDEELLRAADIRVHFDAVVAVAGVSLTARRGEAIGIVGPNGSGKTTFLNSLTGVVPAMGELTVGTKKVALGRPGASRRAGLFRCYQSPQIVGPLTAIENVMIGSDDWHGRGLVGSWIRRVSMLGHEASRRAVAHRALERVGLDPTGDVEAGDLPYGDRRMLEVARGIASGAPLILLDEPSAGLNHVETERLGEVLARLKSEGHGLIVVDHKLDFISALCDRVVVLQLGSVVAEGTPAEVWANASVAEAYLGTQA